ncbi:MAG: HAD-IA family hydrolase [Gemmatimonadetes bacterium]|nr:HAD-IA family hydrolase [Gemmatimonadota bacterium]
MSGAPAPRVVLFDLLSALLDSWSLWDDIAGGEDPGRRWRFSYLEQTYAAGAYVPYVDLVADSAEAVGMPRAFALRLAARWDELAPWPGAGSVLRGLARDWPLGVVTNCSDELGHRAAALVGAPFRAVVTAESAGFYKPDARIYMAGAQAMGARPDEVLFVAGSPFDVVGADAAGMSVVWHNPLGIAADRARDVAVAVVDDLKGLPSLLA